MGACTYVTAAAVVLLALGAAHCNVSPWVTEETPLPQGGIRITALGTGTPDVRRAAVATSYVLQLDNGDTFLWDLGTGAYVNLVTSGIPQAELTRVFVSHLHSDHIADLASLYIGAMFGRREPWHVWGPSCSEGSQYGTAAMVDGLRQFMAWDTYSRRKIDLVGRKDDGDQVVAHEFDSSTENNLIYSRNGVNITSTPVMHYNTSGPVALRLDWNGLSVTYSGDTRPTQGLVDLAQGSDVLLLQNMGPIADFDKLSFESRLLLNTSHITPQQAGHLLSTIRARLPVIHHLTVNDASRPAIISDIRRHYPEGRLHIAEDFDVVDVTKEAITVRKRLVPQTSWGYWKADANVPQHAGSHLTSKL